MKCIVDSRVFCAAVMISGQESLRQSMEPVRNRLSGLLFLQCPVRASKEFSALRDPPLRIANESYDRAEQ